MLYCRWTQHRSSRGSRISRLPWRARRSCAATSAGAPVRRLCGPGSCAPVESFVHPIEDSTLAISPELEAQILRYYHVEKWRIGTIASQLHVHYGTVQRVLAQAGLPAPGPRARSSPIDNYLVFIVHT